jgi:hypothetical protein
VDVGGYLTIIDQPAGSAAWLTPAQELILPALVVFWLVFIGRQVARFRRSSDERRQQLKWLLSGAMAGFVGGAVVTLVPRAGHPFVGDGAGRDHHRCCLGHRVPQPASESAS